VGGAVETFGEAAIEIGPDDRAIAGGRGDRAMVVNVVEDFLEQAAVWRANFETGETRIVLALADPEILDDVRAAPRQDFIQHFGQQQRIDDVALQLDLFDEIPLAGSRCLMHANSPLTT